MSVSQETEPDLADGRTDLVEALAGIVGAGHVLRGAHIGARHNQDLWGGERIGDARLVVRPGTVAEVSEVLALCDRHAQPVVAQGGMTGLVGGGLPGADEVVVSLERLDTVEEIDPVTRTMTVQAGVTLQTVQDLAAEHGLAFPLDLTPRGSCTIGGCLSTNAGGNRVLLYGMTRDLVLGVEAVLADGTVVDGLHKLPKNNAGYDLKHLFIGSEGTLGLVTRAVLRLRPAPRSQQVAFCGLPSIDAAVTLLHRLQAELPGMVSAFEAMWDSAYALVLPFRDELRVPLAGRHPMYVLVECSGSDPDSDSDRFTAALAGCEDLISEAAVGQNPTEVRELWKVRERIPAEALRIHPLFGFDVSLPAGHLAEYVRRCEEDLRVHWPAVDLVVFGHLGDGNVHFAVLTGETTMERKHIVEEIVYGKLADYGGSISAEHGIGFEKRAYLHHSRKPAEIALMRRLKNALDPRGILGPGRVLKEDS
ncbi:MAG: FAD-binding oxidoreductase [Actinocatenispora sp.]